MAALIIPSWRCNREIETILPSAFARNDLQFSEIATQQVKVETQNRGFQERLGNSTDRLRFQPCLQRVISKSLGKLKPWGLPVDRIEQKLYAKEWRAKALETRNTPAERYSLALKTTLFSSQDSYASLHKSAILTIQSVYSLLNISSSSQERHLAPVAA